MKERIVGLGLGILGWASMTSAVHENAFVSSGEYARGLLAVSNCSTDFVPALLESDRQAREGLDDFGFRSAGSELAYFYRMDTSAVRRSSHEGTLGRTASYTSGAKGAEVSVATNMTMDGGKCNRTILAVPSIFHVGTVKTTIASSLTGPGGQQRALTAIGFPPEKYRQTATVIVYHDGQPVPGAQVEVWGVGKGNYTLFGLTPGHWHLFTQRAPLSSFFLLRPSQGGFAPPVSANVRMKLVTPPTGELRLGVQPGYRGGIESIWVKRLDGAPDDSMGTSLEFAYNGEKFEHFGKLLPVDTILFNSTGEEIWTPRIGYPFFYTGATTEHKAAHYLQPQIAGNLMVALKTVWDNDLSAPEKATAAQNPASKRAYWLQLNDMSLEYGGVFHVHAENQCTAPYGTPGGSAGHHTHTIGDDFDVAECYSQGLNRVTGEPPGSSGNCRQISRQLLRHVVEDLAKGALFIESDHYHIRLPVPGLVTAQGAG